MSDVEEVVMKTPDVPKLRTTPLISANERRTTLSRTAMSAREPKYSDDDEDDDDEEEDEEEDEEMGIESDMMKGLFGRDFGMDDDDIPSWTKALGDAESVMDGMVKLYKTDKETFFLHGHEIRKMLEWRFSAEFSRLLDADSD